MAAKDPLLKSEEIKKSIINNNLDDTNKQLIDFYTEFSTQESKYSIVHKINADYSFIKKSWRQRTMNYDKYIEHRSSLIIEILECIDTMIDEYNKYNLFVRYGQKYAQEYVLNTNIQAKKQEIAKEIYLQEQQEKHKFTQSVVKATNIGKVYKSKGVKFCLSPLSLELKLGEITAVVGENGNGKTTLLRMLAGDLAISEGELSYPLLMENGRKDWYSRKQKIAYLPQELPKWYGSVLNNLHFTATIHGIKGNENIDQVNKIIDRLGLQEYRKAKWSEISSGYKTRFSLARALLSKPNLLIFDEPLANLDVKAKEELIKDLRNIVSLQRYPLTAIISSQDLDKVESIADKII